MPDGCHRLRAWLDPRKVSAFGHRTSVPVRSAPVWRREWLSPSRRRGTSACRIVRMRAVPFAEIRRGRVTVSYERETLRREDAVEFAALAARGLREIERITGSNSRHRLRFEVRGSTRISTARGRTIELPTFRVAARSAPYLHEIAHTLLPCRNAPAWFSEGLASFLEAHISESGAGYDSHLFTAGGNRGVHADAARWLSDLRGRRVLPFVGTRGMPRDLVTDRHNVAAPFYVLSHSLVKFLADRTGVPGIIRLARARTYAHTVRRISGKSSAALRSEWLELLAQVAPPASSEPISL